MGAPITDKLEALRTDFERKTGAPFRHFYCPIVHRDESAILCRAHIVNEAFRDASRKWTVQRRDVDNFYGAHFESEFVLLQERGRYHPAEMLADPTLRKKLQPDISVDGRQVDYYQPGPRIPPQHTELVMQREKAAPVRLALKLSPSEAVAAQAGAWQVSFARDLRLPALVSLLKAAHLTMFDLLGYSWGLSPGGHLVGREGLGVFFDESRGLERRAILRRADTHFRQFINLVRPINSSLSEIVGTVDDHLLYLCTGSPKAWAFLVFVRLGSEFHGVLLPTCEDDESAARFLRFMNDPSPRIFAKLTRFMGEHWEISTREQTLHWPQANWETPAV